MPGILLTNINVRKKAYYIYLYYNITIDKAFNIENVLIFAVNSDLKLIDTVFYN